MVVGLRDKEVAGEIRDEAVRGAETRNSDVVRVNGIGVFLS